MPDYAPFLGGVLVGVVALALTILVVFLLYRALNKRHPAAPIPPTLSETALPPTSKPLAATDAEFAFIHTEAPASRSPEQIAAWERITPRKKEAALLVAQGLTSAQAAAKMNVRADTVEGYLKEVYRALDVHSRSELVNFIRDLAA